MCRATTSGSRLWAWIVTHWPPRISDFSLAEDATLFMHSQWPISQPVFVAYRGFLASYTVSWLIMSVVNAGQTTGLGGFFIFLTNWTYIVLSMYLTIAFVSTAYASHKSRLQESYVNRIEHQPDDNDNNSVSSSDVEASHHRVISQTAPSQSPFYFRITWVLLTICLTFSPIISVIYWAFIFDPEFVYANQGGAYGVALTVHRHAFNTLFIYLDLAMSAIPIRFLHVVYPCAYGAIYVFFSLVYYWAGGVNPYVDHPAIYPTLLDWTVPGKTSLVVIGFVFVVIIFHSIAFGSCKLRMYLADRFHVVTLGQRHTKSLRNENHVDDECHVTDAV